MLHEFREILKIAGIGELVKIGDKTIGVLGQHHSHKVASNKSCAACNKDSSHNCLKKHSNGFCQDSIGASSRAEILLQSNRLFKGLVAGLEKSVLLQANGSTSIESLSNTNFAIPCLLT